MWAICLPRRNWFSLCAFCSSRLTFFLKQEFWMILFRADATLASSISKFWKWGKFWIERDDFKSSTESTIFTSLIIASEWEPEQALTWVLNLIFQQENVESVGEFVKIEVPRSVVLIDQPCNSVDTLLLPEKKISWLMVSLQFSGFESSLCFFLHLSRQVSLYYLALSFRL